MLIRLENVLEVKIFMIIMEYSTIKWINCYIRIRLVIRSVLFILLLECDFSFVVDNNWWVRRFLLEIIQKYLVRFLTNFVCQRTYRVINILYSYLFHAAIKNIYVLCLGSSILVRFLGHHITDVEFLLFYYINLDRCF